MQAKVQSKPVPHWEDWKGQLTAGGDRDVIIVASFGEAAARIGGAVPRSPHEPTEEDKRRMVDQGLSPEECTDDISILQARLRLDKESEVVEMLASEGTRELSRGYILERIESQLKATEKAGGESITIVCDLINHWSWMEKLNCLPQFVRARMITHSSPPPPIH